MDNFYMTLPSNVKSSTFTNTVANYKTKLAYRLELNDNWEVGLSTISYTNSWYNIPYRELIKIKYFMNGSIHYLPYPVILKKGSYNNIDALLGTINTALQELEAKENTPDRMNHRYIREHQSEFTDLVATKPDPSVLDQLRKDRIEYWHNKHTDPNLNPGEKFTLAMEIGTKLNEEMLKIKSNNTYQSKLANAISIELPRFNQSKNFKNIECHLKTYKHGYVFPEMTYDLCRMMGINKEQFDLRCQVYLDKLVSDYNSLSDDDKIKFQPNLPKEYNKAIIFGTGLPELNSCLHSLFLYCDIVKPSFVGDSVTKLLRFIEIPPKSQFGEQIVLTYPDIHYYPVNSRDIESIEIDIRDDTGEQIPFLYGRTICILHFRKIK